MDYLELEKKNIVYDNYNIVKMKKQKKQIELKNINKELLEIESNWKSVKNKELSIIDKSDISSKVDNISLNSFSSSLYSNNYKNERNKFKEQKNPELNLNNVYDNINKSIFLNEAVTERKKFVSCEKKYTNLRKLSIKNNSNFYSKIKNEETKTSTIIDIKLNNKKLKVNKNLSKNIYNKNYFSKKDTIKVNTFHVNSKKIKIKENSIKLKPKEIEFDQTKKLIPRARKNYLLLAKNKKYK